MQAAKDSFYMALCTRLQAVNPQRTVVLDGELRPGIVVVENEAAIGTPVMDAFCVVWGAVAPMMNSDKVVSTLMKMGATIRYGTCGANHGEGDRGRSLTQMDAELAAICMPRQTAKFDYTQDPPIGLGSTVFWNSPVLSATEQTAGVYGRTAGVEVYFYPEATV